jgi:hypothetical protein
MGAANFGRELALAAGAPAAADFVAGTGFEIAGLGALLEVASKLGDEAGGTAAGAAAIEADAAGASGLAALAAARVGSLAFSCAGCGRAALTGPGSGLEDPRSADTRSTRTATATTPAPANFSVRALRSGSLSE